MATPTDLPRFPEIRLPAELLADLRRSNPWWEDRPPPETPATRRHLVGRIPRRMDHRLAPITVVRGPRQVGKTSAQLQLIADRLGAGTPGSRVLRVQADRLSGLESLSEPLLRIVDWFEQDILQATLNEVARAGGETLLVFDEVQNLPAWSDQLKFLVDHSTTDVLVTGSSALRIERGCSAGGPKLLPLAPEGVIAEPDAHPVVGPLAEGICGALLSTLPQLGLAWKPGRIEAPEVDLVLTVGSRRIPMEVKYQRKIDYLRDTDGLRGFIEKRENNAPFGVLVTLLDEQPYDPRIVTLPLSTLLLLR